MALASQAIVHNFFGIEKPAYQNGLYSLRYSGFVGSLVKGLLEQKAIIETQLTENDNFKFVRANCLGPEARIKVLEISQVKCLSEIYNFRFNIFNIWEKVGKHNFQRS